jgi:hypothetical protein
MYDAKVLADSISPNGYRVTTLEITHPRFILAEANTHRMISKNSASSRAIPVERRIEQISRDPFVPEAFGRNKGGMQSDENLDGDVDALARIHWDRAKAAAIREACDLSSLNVHKQHANRVLEPFAWHTAVFTATEWDNWDALRVSKMAQPEMYKIAGMMREVRLSSIPLAVDYGDWHLPYVRGVGDEPALAAEYDMRVNGINPVKVSVGRCAAVSYERQSSKSDMEKAAARCDGLVANGHMSPLEHALRPMNERELEMFGTTEFAWDWDRSEFTPTGRMRHFLGNVEGWVQYRKLIPGEAVYKGA